MRFAFAFAFAFALAACGAEQPVAIEESPTLGVCSGGCFELNWTAEEGTPEETTCCDCRRGLPAVADLCGGNTIVDNAAEQCPECNDVP
jgi:hypothetical protein